MGVLLIRCPSTCGEVSTGIEIDPEGLAHLPDKLVASKCPVCGLEHAWF
jgi:hypothetical protein